MNIQTNAPISAPPHLDRLSALLQRFEIRAGVFRAGPMCGMADFTRPGEGGHIHILRGGMLRMTNGNDAPVTLREPTVLFYPRALPHTLDTGGADREVALLCARIDLGGAGNPLVAALPDMVAVPFRESAGLRAVLDLLVEEAFAVHCGRQAVLDRLCEVVVVKLLRHVIGSGQVAFGLLAGLSHPTLRRALTAMHDAPEQDWTLERLAETAGMSRTAFANAFRDVVGQTPGRYLAQWRLALAKEQLNRGEPLKQIAREVGYASPAALSRAYARQFGRSARAAKAHTRPN